MKIAIPENIENLKLPSPEAVNYWKLADKRIFYIQDEISEDTLEIQKAILSINIDDQGIEYSKRKPIVLLIHTPGGYLQETMSLATMMIMSKTPIITVNIGMAYSGGALLLLAGHKRYAMKYSKAMIHTGSGGVSGTYEQTEAAQKIYRKQVDEMSQYILERSKIAKKTLTKNRATDWYMDHDEQIKYGLVDEILNNLEDILI